jgi:hypothetical protein
MEKPNPSFFTGKCALFTLAAVLSTTLSPFLEEEKITEICEKRIHPALFFRLH